MKLRQFIAGVVALVAVTFIPVTATTVLATPSASATSPQACHTEPLPIGVIGCYQIIGHSNYVDDFSGSLHSVTNCAYWYWISISGPGHFWQRYYYLPPHGYVPITFWVFGWLPAGTYTATFENVEWGTRYYMRWNVIR